MKADLNYQTTKYKIDSTNRFNKNFKRIKKQGKDLSKLKEVIRILANGDKLESKYHDHQLANDKTYNNCRECHIEPDWLLIYKYQDDELVLLLFATGTHSLLFT